MAAMISSGAADAKQFTAEFLKYIDASPTPFHCCKESIDLLAAAGFSELDESKQWVLEAGGKYYYTRNATTLVAFVVGGSYEKRFAETGVCGGIKVVGAHTDSPVLKLKPCSKKSAHGYLQIGVECYGGGLWHTWFDRELALAGSVIVENDDGGGFERRLVHIKRPLMRVPTLCIHLQTSAERGCVPPAPSMRQLQRQMLGRSS